MKRHVYGCCLFVVTTCWLSGTAALADPVFSFWGDLSGARRILLEKHVASNAPPLEVDDPEILARWGIAPGMPLELIRGGVAAGRGTVGKIFVGWVPRAGSNETAWFLPAGLPDSITVKKNPVVAFPRRTDRDYDLYVLGARDVRVIEPACCDSVSGDDFGAVVQRAVDAKAFRCLDAPRELQRYGPGRGDRGVAGVDTVATWLSGHAPPDVIVLKPEASVEYRITRCEPYFVDVEAGGRPQATLQGSLDTFLMVDGACYMVMRSWRSGTGMWRYVVYSLAADGNVVEICSDGNWST